MSEAKHKPMGRAKAIRAKCLDCCGDSRAEVRRCEIEECPLWNYRLGTSAKIDSGVRTAAKRGVFDTISGNGYEESREGSISG